MIQKTSRQAVLNLTNQTIKISICWKVQHHIVTSKITCTTSFTFAWKKSWNQTTIAFKQNKNIWKFLYIMNSIITLIAVIVCWKTDGSKRFNQKRASDFKRSNLSSYNLIRCNKQTGTSKYIWWRLWICYLAIAQDFQIHN